VAITCHSTSMRSKRDFRCATAARPQPAGSRRRGDVRPRVDVERRTGRADEGVRRKGDLRTDVTRRRCGRGRSLAE